jgi:hypothetical protein
MGATLPEPIRAEAPQAALPAEFTLHLGVASSDHVAKVAQSLSRLGAEVQIEPDGSLVAFRPLL